MTQICKNCNIEKDISNFGKCKNLKNGYKYFCKSCFNVLYNETRKLWKSKNTDKIKFQNKRYKESHKDFLCYRENLRRAKKLQATPKWANLSIIKNIYKNCPKGYQVDHIIPLQGKNVCGLHVETNLQYLTSSENSKKGNKF